MCYARMSMFVTCRMHTIKKIMLHYRTLQILATMMNDIQQMSLVSPIITFAIPLTAFAASVLIRSLQRIDRYAVVAVTANVLINGAAALLLILGCMAQLLQESEKCLKNINTIVADFPEVNGRNAFKKFFKSCPVVKAKFGSINFVERLTPVNCINFINDLTLQMLLTTN